MSLLITGGLEQMHFEGPSQPQLFCDSKELEEMVQFLPIHYFFKEKQSKKEKEQHQNLCTLF